MTTDQPAEIVLNRILWLLHVQDAWTDQEQRARLKEALVAWWIVNDTDEGTIQSLVDRFVADTDIEAVVAGGEQASE